MKNYIAMCVAALCALLFAACNNNAIEDIPNVNPTDGNMPAPKLKTITLSLGDATRTTYTEEGKALKVKWESGDKIGVYRAGASDTDNDPDEFTLTSGAGSETATFTGTFTKYINWADEGEPDDFDDTFYIIVYPYTPGKTQKEIVNEAKAKLIDCQKGDLDHIHEYDPLICKYGYYDETDEDCQSLTHVISVVKVTTPQPMTNQTKVGIRGAWAPGFTYYANNNGSTTTYIAVPASTYKSYTNNNPDNGFKDFFVAMYDDTNHECSLYKKSRTTGGKIEVGKLSSVTVADGDKILTYDCDGLKENHEYVDMGNNVGMATMNIGANSPEGYGYYFRFGEQMGWIVFSDAYKVSLNTYNCKQYNSEGTETTTKFNNTTALTFSSSGWNLCNQNNTQMEDFQGKTGLKVNNTTYGDAAKYNWGGNWKMMNSDFPSTWTATEVAARQGYTLTSNNKTVFLPGSCHCVNASRDGEYEDEAHTTPRYCAHYWSTKTDNTTLSSDTKSQQGYYWFFVIGRQQLVFMQGPRSGGFSIRPVIDLP